MSMMHLLECCFICTTILERGPVVVYTAPFATRSCRPMVSRCLEDHQTECSTVHDMVVLMMAPAVPNVTPGLLSADRQ